MKVEDISHIIADNHRVGPVKERPDANGQSLAFARQLMTLSEAQYQHYMQDLQERIFKQGEKLKQKADLKAVMEYRALIGELLEEAASNAFEGKKAQALDTKGRNKTHFVIRSVNEKLEELTREILSDQQDNIRILQMVDDIRGLLVDLFM
jgi:hypothetical protein